ncbi:MAG: thioredoxin [Planctomycetes bacterium]|nr:thioredoxin [Planctomycetota bacterium]
MIEIGRAATSSAIALALISFCVVIGCSCSPEDAPAPPAPEAPSNAALSTPTVPSKTPVEIRSAGEFDAVVLRASIPVLVDFHAVWCGPCRIQGPIVERLAEKSAGAYLVAKLDVDRVEEIPARYGIRSIPTLIVFSGGKERKRFVGLTEESDLATAIEAAKGS